MKYVLPYDWDWNLCMVFGSMVAATDPVAVVALLEELVSAKIARRHFSFVCPEDVHPVRDKFGRSSFGLTR